MIARIHEAVSARDAFRLRGGDGPGELPGASEEFAEHLKNVVTTKQPLGERAVSRKQQHADEHASAAQEDREDTAGAEAGVAAAIGPVVATPAVRFDAPKMGAVLRTVDGHGRAAPVLDTSRVPTSGITRLGSEPPKPTPVPSSDGVGAARTAPSMDPLVDMQQPAATELTTAQANQGLPSLDSAGLWRRAIEDISRGSGERTTPQPDPRDRAARSEVAKPSWGSARMVAKASSFVKGVSDTAATQPNVVANVVAATSQRSLESGIDAGEALTAAQAALGVPGLTPRRRGVTKPSTTAQTHATPLASAIGALTLPSSTSTAHAATSSVPVAPVHHAREVSNWLPKARVLVQQGGGVASFDVEVSEGEKARLEVKVKDGVMDARLWVDRASSPEVARRLLDEVRGIARDAGLDAGEFAFEQRDAPREGALETAVVSPAGGNAHAETDGSRALAEAPALRMTGLINIVV